MLAIGYRMDQIDASVAPPRLMISTLGISFLSRSGNETGIQSPLKSARRKQERFKISWHASAYFISISRSVGTVFHRVTRSCTNISNQAAGLRQASSAGITIVP